MSGPGRSNLNVNGRGQDANWFRNPYNPFAYQPFVGAVNHIDEIFEISPVSVGYQFGGEVDFELDKRGDLLGRIELVINRSAVTASTGTPYINEWEVYSMIDKIL